MSLHALLEARDHVENVEGAVGFFLLALFLLLLVYALFDVTVMWKPVASFYIESFEFNGEYSCLLVRLFPRS